MSYEILPRCVIGIWRVPGCLCDAIGDVQLAVRIPDAVQVESNSRVLFRSSEIVGGYLADVRWADCLNRHVQENMMVVLEHAFSIFLKDIVSSTVTELQKM